MTELYCTVEMQGPFRWFGSADDALFSQEVASESGIYLWTVPRASGHLTYYVGETGRSFGMRMKEHVKQYFSGMYRVFDPLEFAKGHKVLIWDGMWRKGEEIRLAEFVSKLPELSLQTARLLESMRVFVGPLDAPTRVRRRIEAAIAACLRQEDGVVGSFQDSDVVYQGRSADEVPLRVRLCSTAEIAGLPEVLEA